MVAFVNRLTGSLMYVHESRVEEYEALGHVRVETAPARAEGGTGEQKVKSRKKAAVKAPHPSAAPPPSPLRARGPSGDARTLEGEG